MILLHFFFDEQAEIYPKFGRRFFEINEPWDVDRKQIIQCFAVGCAFCDQTVELFDHRHLHVARRNHECRYLGINSTGIRRVQDLTGDPFDPDGMSGGAVLYIREDAFGPKIELGGMIQRGGGSYYHYIDTAQILLFLDAAMGIHYNDAA